jgi:hypothetical protein
VSKTTRESLLTAAYLAVGVAGALGGWFLVCRVLHYRPVALPIIVVGFFAGLVYATARLRGAGSSMLVLLLYLPSSLMVQMFAVSARSGRLPRVTIKSVLDAAIYALPIAAALLAAVLILKNVAKPKVGKCLLAGLLLAAAYAVQMSIFLIRSHMSLPADFLVNQALVGAGVGIGIGLGMELVDLLWSRQGAQVDFEPPD